jgi:hypothetical protein
LAKKADMAEEVQLSIREVTMNDREIIYQMICGLENMVMDREGFDFVFKRNLESTNIRYFLGEYLKVNPVGNGELPHSAFTCTTPRWFPKSRKCMWSLEYRSQADSEIALIAHVC